MQLLSALTSTTSPLAMQAMPVLGQPTAGFAALLAGMAPAETVAANAAPAVRQIAALPGNALPVAVPDDATPVLPVSATEAVSMLPAETAGPKVAVPVAAAAVATLAKLLPDEDAPPPETATPAIPVLPPPPRFALPVPRGRKPEADVPRERPVEAEADDAVATDAEAMPPPACMPMPETVVPAELMAGNAVLPALVPPVAPEPAPLPPAQTILQDGSVVASDPATPMRTEKRAATRAPEAAVPTHAMPIGSQAAENAAQRTRTLPASRPAAAMAAAQVQPAIGQITPLPAERIVPVHVVVPPQGDGATADAPPAQVPASPQAMSFDAEGIVRPATPATATPMPVAAGQRTSIPVTGASVSTLRDAVPPVRQQVSTDDVTALATDPAIAARATIGAAPSSRASMASTHSASANQPVEMTVRPAPASAAIPTLASDGQVLDDILRQPLADVVAGAAPAVAVEGPRPAAPLRPFDPVAMTTPVAVAPATPRATTIPATPVRGFRQPVADGADNDRMAGTAAPNRVPAANAANAANAATAPVVAGDAAPPAQPTAQPVASLPPAPGVTAQAPADASVVRQPIAGEAAAPVVTVAAPGEPVAKPLPVTRIALPTPTAEPAAAPAIVDAAAPAPRARRDEDAPALPTAAAAPDPVVLRPVAAAAQAGQPTLDTRQPQWMEGMIDRIETLRESAGTGGETRIRLSPDALGDVEIAIRTSDDGKVHVHFNSENADAGRLLADAQPRLVQLAEARGLKLGGMQVDVGTQQQSQRQAQEQGNAPPRAPRPATTTAGQPSTNDNQRIA